MQNNVRQKWLVLFNCQAMGLASSLQLLCDQIEVVYHDPSSLTENKEQVLSTLDNYDRVIIAPWVEGFFGIGLGERGNVRRLPAFHFSAYHPDLCNLSTVGGPLRGNHSVLAYAAFKVGLEISDTLRLYNERTYDAMGFFDQWDSEREGLLERYSSVGIDLSREFMQWTRSGAFAYIPSHPKIDCLSDMARAALKRDGLPVRQTRFLPHDVLANGVGYPVYPEIASRLGIRGDYLFKIPKEYRLIELERFVRESFEFYEGAPDLVPTPPYMAVVDHAMYVINNM